jgi:CheY-like chemotaxis protein/predicted regulator of Ras-like GTPase activity (Roadblock/LC7/MglB family)
MSESEKKIVLVVDDEDMFLRTVGDGFARYADRITLLTAPNGKVAADILDAQRVDLVVTDLKMPELDGFGLIAHMSRVRPDVPVIVMTAFGTPETEARLEDLGVVQYLDKPFDFEALARKVFDTLAASASGHLLGIALPTVLQMIELDRKTCTLRVRAGDLSGQLFFKRGLLVDATAGSHEGLPAAMEIVSWQQPEIDFLSGPMHHARSLDLSVTQVLLDAFRMKDEEERNRQREERKKARSDTPPLPPPPPPVRAAPPPPAKPAAAAPATRVADVARADAPQEKSQKKEVSMSAQDKLKELAAIEGFNGAAVYTPQGELLAAHVGEVANLKEIGVLANNVLMNAQKASLEMGTGRGQQVHVEGESSHILVRCLNEGTDPLRSQPGKAHIHMVVVLKPDAPIGMAKLRTNSIIAKMAEDFRF